jgi:beta-glucosidase
MKKRKSVDDLIFPKNFLWGSATSAHQVEGNNNNNQWWIWEQEGGHIADGTVSGLACDQYNRYKEDIQLMKELGHQCYRFSLEWSRIEPEQGRFNAKEIEHYRDVLATLVDNGITPMVTLHHFTNPIWLQKMGAWENSEIIDLFERFTIHVAEELGDLIFFWNTINEPMIVAFLGYLIGEHPPNKRNMPLYLKVAVNLIKSHAKSYQAIHQTVKNVKRPQVGIVASLVSFEPSDPNWWFLDGMATGTIGPPFAKNEQYPPLKGSSDFIGVNYYTRFLIKEGIPDPINGPGEKNDMGWEIYPQGLLNLLITLKQYNRPIYITENGICTAQDESRAKFIIQHLSSIYRAMQQNVVIRGYLYWSLMDNFEWAQGFAKRFGLVEVNYETLERKSRPSAYLYRDIIKKNRMTKEMLEKYR